MKISEKDLLVDTYSNISGCDMRIVHMPTGLVAERKQIKSQIIAKREMIVELRQRIRDSEAE